MAKDRAHDETRKLPDMGKALGWGTHNNSAPHRESSDRAVFIGDDNKRGPLTNPFHPGAGHVSQGNAEGGAGNSKGTEGIRKKSVQPHDGIELGEVVED
jgi:hypothetical protein